MDADDGVIGVVGHGDVLIAGLDHRSIHGVTVAEAMTADVLVVAPDLDVDQLARRLVSGGRRFVPVVDRGRLVGIVTCSDLLRQMTAAAAGEWPPAA